MPPGRRRSRRGRLPVAGSSGHRRRHRRHRHSDAAGGGGRHCRRVAGVRPVYRVRRVQRLVVRRVIGAGGGGRVGGGGHCRAVGSRQVGRCVERRKVVGRNGGGRRLGHRYRHGRHADYGNTGRWLRRWLRGCRRN